MKVTHFYQSCLLIEEGSARILIDPSGEEAERFDSFGQLDAVLYTHEHHDHFEPALAEKFHASGVPVYANASTAKLMNFEPNVVTDGQEITAKDVVIKAIELPHCLLPNGKEGPQNTGYLINEKLFHPGDGKELEGLQVDNLALPITGPDISIRDAFAFAVQLGAKVTFPIHYDTLGAKPEAYKAFVERLGFEFELRLLPNGTSTEL